MLVRRILAGFVKAICAVRGNQKHFTAARCPTDTARWSVSCRIFSYGWRANAERPIGASIL